MWRWSADIQLCDSLITRSSVQNLEQSLENKEKKLLFSNFEIYKLICIYYYCPLNFIDVDNMNNNNKNVLIIGELLLKKPYTKLHAHVEKIDWSIDW